MALYSRTHEILGRGYPSAMHFSSATLPDATVMDAVDASVDFDVLLPDVMEMVVALSVENVLNGSPYSCMVHLERFTYHKVVCGPVVRHVM